jgi:uncharacterized protein (TIGR02246 family)
MPQAPITAHAPRRAGAQSARHLTHGSHMYRLLLIGASVSAASIGWAQTSASGGPKDDVDLSNPDVAAIVQVERTYEKVFAAGDAQAIAALYAPDCIYMANGRHDVHGTAESTQRREAFFKDYAGTISIHLLEVKVMGDMAYDRSTITIATRPKAGGETVTHVERAFEVMKKVDGQWRSYRLITNALDAGT